MRKTKFKSFMTAIETAKKLLSDEQASQVIGLYPEWRSNASYNAGDKVVYNGKLYSVLQTHSAQEGWTPTASPSLFATVLAGQDGTAIGEWQQPDSTNPYMMGDKVIFGGAVYESVIDYNIWSPSAYPAGWREVPE